jgi:hypothetical protein
MGGNLVEELRHAPLEQFDELGLHELVLVGNVEHDDFPFAEMMVKTPLDFVAVTPLHDQYPVGPGDQLFGERLRGVGIKTGRTRFDGLRRTVLAMSPALYAPG